MVLYYKFILRPPILGKIHIKILLFTLFYLKPLWWLLLINYLILLGRNYFLEATLDYHNQKWWIQQKEIKIKKIFILPKLVVITINQKLYLIIPEQLSKNNFRKLLYLIKKGD